MRTGSVTDNTNLINNINNAGNKLIQDGVKDLKGIGENAFEAGKAKCNEIKKKGLGVWNFLKKAGVILGTALGAFAGLVAAGAIAVTLPVSLPVLGAIAGGLFLGGSIAALVDNVRDPGIKEAKNVIIQTLKDIGSGMLMAIPTLLTYLFNPEKAGEDINGLIGKAKEIKTEVESDLKDIRDIVEKTTNQISDKAKQAIADLKDQLNDLHTKTARAIQNQTQESLEELSESKTNVLNSLNVLKAEGNKLQGKDGKKLSEKVESIREKVDDKDLNATFQKLNESFSKRSKEKTDKASNGSQISIKAEIENDENFGNGTLDLSEIKNPNDEIVEGDLGQTAANLGNALDHILNEPKIKDNNNPKRSVIENQNTENKVVDLLNDKKTNSTENLKTEVKIENPGTDNKKIKEDINALVDTFNKSSFHQNNYIKVQGNNNKYYFKQFAQLQGLITSLEQKNLKAENLKGILLDTNKCIADILGNASVTHYLKEQDISTLKQIGTQAANVVNTMQHVPKANIHSVEVKTVKKAGYVQWAQYSPQITIGSVVVSFA